MTDEQIKQVRHVFEKAYLKAQEMKFAGYRAEDQTAWYSPQRDLVNLMPSILSSACCLAGTAMEEEAQLNLENYPTALLKALQGLEGGAVTIPALTASALGKHPEEMMQLLSCIGLAVLMAQAHLPAFRVTPDGQMSELPDQELLLDETMCLLSPKTRKRAVREIKERFSYPAAFEEAFVKIAEELSRIDQEIENGED